MRRISLQQELEIHLSGFVAPSSNDGRFRHYETREEADANCHADGRVWECSEEFPAVHITDLDGDYGWGFGDTPALALANALGADWGLEQAPFLPAAE